MQFQVQELDQANCQGVQDSNKQTIKCLTNEVLISEVKTLAREERRLTHEILLHIQEVERRKLHLDLGFPSILDWLVKDIGYSESAAHRRMQAARLLVAVPNAGEKLKSGEVSLSTLAKVQSVVKQEEKRTHAKIENSFKAELIEQLESKSTREAEKILVQAFPEIFFQPTNHFVRSAVVSHASASCSIAKGETISSVRKNSSQIPNTT